MTDQQLDPPGDLEGLYALIRERHSSFPKRLTQVSHYVVDNPDEIAFGSVASIAEATRVTPSTVMRFAQLLGYDGFSTFQEIFRQNIRAKLLLHDQAAVGKSNVDVAPSADDALGQTVAECCNALSELRKMVRATEIDSAAEIVSRARCVFIHASRSTIPMAVALQHGLIQNGVHCALSMDVTGGDEVLSFATNKDVAIFIARSADKGSEVQASRVAANGVTIIAMVDSALNPFNDVASAVFKLGKTGGGNFVMPTLFIALVQVLASRIDRTRNHLALS